MGMNLSTGICILLECEEENMKNSMLGIDIGTGSIKLVTKDQCVLIDTAENVFENDHFIAFDGMSEIFKTAVKGHGIRNKKVSLILPDEDLYFSRTTLPLMSEKQLKVNLPYEFSKIVGKDADQYIYDYSLISRNDHEMDLLDVKEAKMRSMKSYIEEHSDANQGDVAVYNNLANEIDALANILQPTASNVSIQWAEPYLQIQSLEEMQILHVLFQVMSLRKVSLIKL